MSVGREQAERIAHLARLSFEEDELTQITGELNHILEHVEALRAVERAAEDDETGGHGPAHVQTASTRGEAAERPDPLLRLLGSVAPDWREEFFVVPPLPGTQGGDGA